MQQAIVASVHALPEKKRGDERVRDMKSRESEAPRSPAASRARTAL